jgi:hypothetical protein
MQASLTPNELIELLPYLTSQERVEMDRLLTPLRRAADVPDTWEPWLRALFPAYCRAPFAPRHRAFWEWVWAIASGVRPAPFVAIWPRGGAKSTGAELAAVAVGARGVRRYVWYASETQDQADRHVETIAGMLESSQVERHYPLLAQRKVGKFGNSKGWRRSRLWTADGFVIDAIGLDSARRGVKVDAQRPDMMIFDDIDSKHDGAGITARKIEALTHSLLPAGTSYMATLFVQNLIHPDSVAARLVDGRAEFLSDRIVSGPFPALEGFTYAAQEQGDGRLRHIVTGGTPTWAGQDVDACQDSIDTYGIVSFRQESQHELDAEPAAVYRHCNADEVPDLVRVVVWVDPAVTSTDQSDSMAVQVDGIDERDIIYRLHSWEDITTPEDAIGRALRWALYYGALYVGIETDQGGDTWQSVYERAWAALMDATAGSAEAAVLDKEIAAAREALQQRKPAFRSAKAGAGYGSKAERNKRMMTDYGSASIVHVRGPHATLEAALNRFAKGNKPFDLTDAAFWGWNDLRNNEFTLMVSFL